MVVQKRIKSWVPAEANALERTIRASQNKEAQKADTPHALAEYRAAEAALRAKIQKLRSERLAREASLKAISAVGGRPLDRPPPREIPK
jgi:hypothetical protein